ncbi:MAG: CHASE2 domain-containing protein [Pseudomonadota bacterium]
METNSFTSGISGWKLYRGPTKTIIWKRGAAGKAMTREYKKHLPWMIGVFITLLLSTLMIFQFSPLEVLEEKFYDVRFQLRGKVPHPGNIVIVAIDEKSLQGIGRWPWTRDKMARLVQQLSGAGAEMVVFDLFFSEPEAHDRIFGKAMDQAGNVVLPLVFFFDKSSGPMENPDVLSTAISSIQNPERFSHTRPITAKGILMPVPELLAEAMGLGHINMIPDRDGTLRWEVMVLAYQGTLYPSLDLLTAALYLGIPLNQIKVKATEGIRLGASRFIPTDRFGRALIHYYGPGRHFEYLSAYDMITGGFSPEKVRGKIVLVGAEAIGIADLTVTPFSPAALGVEKHANMIASILENRFLRKNPLGLDLTLLILSGGIFSLIIYRFKALGGALTTLVFLGLIFSAGYALFVQKGLWISTAYPAVNIFLIFISQTAYSYAVEERYARKIRSMFSSYVTERVVSELIRNPHLAEVGGARREITILFSDIRGFTAFSEKHPPEEVVGILNEFLGAMTEVIFKWEGTLDKFVGDAIMAFWGAPLEQKNHAELALRCALNMKQRLRELQEHWDGGKPILEAGIGLNSGEVLVGNIGVEGKKMDYTVIGDHVNLASRVESLTRSYYADLLITRFTLEKVETLIKTSALGHLSLRGRGKATVKGREGEVEIFEVKALSPGRENVLEPSPGI